MLRTGRAARSAPRLFRPSNVASLSRLNESRSLPRCGARANASSSARRAEASLAPRGAVPFFAVFLPFARLAACHHSRFAMVSTRSSGADPAAKRAAPARGAASPAKKARRAPKAAAAKAAAAPKAAVAKAAAAPKVVAARKDGERRYWLLKSEPESRLEKGVDMKFGIDDLAACVDQTEPWDGVRNHEAKNAMLAMAVGDLGFFYRAFILCRSCCSASFLYL